MGLSLLAGCVSGWRPLGWSLSLVGLVHLLAVCLENQTVFLKSECFEAAASVLLKLNPIPKLSAEEAVGGRNLAIPPSQLLLSSTVNLNNNANPFMQQGCITFLFFTFLFT